MRNGWYYSFQLLGLDFPMISVSNLLKILYQNLSRFCIRVSQDDVSDSLKIMCQNLSRSCVRFSRDPVSDSLEISYPSLSRSCIGIYQDFVSESLKIMYQILSLDPLSYIKLESKEKIVLLHYIKNYSCHLIFLINQSVCS